MAERLKATVLKTVGPVKGSMGSNPISSSIWEVSKCGHCAPLKPVTTRFDPGTSHQRGDTMKRTKAVTKRLKQIRSITQEEGEQAPRKLCELGLCISMAEARRLVSLVKEEKK